MYFVFLTCLQVDENVNFKASFSLKILRYNVLLKKKISNAFSLVFFMVRYYPLTHTSLQKLQLFEKKYIPKTFMCPGSIVGNFFDRNRISVKTILDLRFSEKNEESQASSYQPVKPVFSGK